MIARVCYALLAFALLALTAIFAVRVYRERRESLPVVQAPPEVAGQSCAAAIETARHLTKSGALDRARLAYLWLLGHCESSPTLPHAMLEAGSLFGHLLRQPREAQRVYEEFLRRFPSHPEAGDVTYHLARLEIDSEDYTAAVAHLTLLAQRYPDSWHEESAKFLAVKATEMLTAQRRKRRTILGQVAALVPTNLVSVLALLTALGPSIIQTVSKTRQESGSGRPRSRWVMATLVIALTLLNYVINNVDSARRNRVLMEKLDRLAAVSVPSRGSQ